MAERSEPRVGVYIDFDNIVISQYDAVHGRGSWSKDKARNATGKALEKLQAATVDIGAVLDFASSFGAVAISRAYADWAAPANSLYRKQLTDRAVDLVQLFNTAGTKNGADIRLAIDVVEDLFRLDDITHIVIVAGDSDYIPLAQRARRLGRVVVGIGVTGSTSAAFTSAVDEFSYYADLIDDEDAPAPAPVAAPVTATEPPTADPQRAAAELAVRALRVARRDDNVDGWVAASAVKQQMKRLDPSFEEKKLGFKSFTDFVKSVKGVELQEDGQARRVRLKGRG
ncbi:NYN domain-containing protein [Schumannella luteola]